jgi:phage tail-like protein
MVVMTNKQYSWPVKLVCGGGLLLALLVYSCGFGGSKAGAQSAATKSETAGRLIFQVEVEGRWSGTFSTCSGLGSENEVVEEKATDKGGQQITKKIPGRLRWHDVTLTRALTSDRKVWEWRQEVVVGKVAGARQKCTITMMGVDGKPVAAWELTNAWPTDLTEGVKEAGATVTEQVTIAHEGVTRKQ